jgi:hypothetical protein
MFGRMHMHNIRMSNEDQTTTTGLICLSGPPMGWIVVLVLLLVVVSQLETIGTVSIMVPLLVTKSALEGTTNESQIVVVVEFPTPSGTFHSAVMVEFIFRTRKEVHSEY